MYYLLFYECEDNTFYSTDKHVTVQKSFNLSHRNPSWSFYSYFSAVNEDLCDKCKAMFITPPAGPGPKVMHHGFSGNRVSYVPSV